MCAFLGCELEDCSDRDAKIIVLVKESMKITSVGPSHQLSIILRSTNTGCRLKIIIPKRACVDV